MRIGLGALLCALFFAIVAGGSVPLDAQPLAEPLSGLLITFVSAIAFVFGLFLVSSKRNDMTLIGGSLLMFFAGASVTYDLFAGGDAFSLVRLLCSLFVFGGLAFVLLKNRVVQLPAVLYNGPIVVFVAAMTSAVFVSEFLATSLDGLQYWAVCVGAYFLTTAVVGRISGPRMVLETIVSAADFVAIKGIFEYLAMRADEPTYRIFADWNNPNALAGILVAAFPLAIGLACSSKGARRWLSLGGAVVIVVSALLTQSKGGLLVLPICVIAFFVVAACWKARSKALLIFAPVAIAVGVFYIIQPKTQAPIAESIDIVAPTQPQTPAPLSRVINSGGEAMQSSEYRKLLWKGAISLVKDQVVGYGPSTYRFYSAKAGLTEQTQLAHQSYLQIAVEGGVLALVAIVFLAVVWVVRMFRGALSLSSERNMLRAGVVASVVALGANGFVESNFYYLGTGLCLFVLLATGLQLAADGTSPESLPIPLRITIVTILCVAPFLVSIWAMRLEFAKIAMVTSLRTLDLPAIALAGENLRSIPILDDEGHYLLSIVESDTTQRLQRLQTTVDTGPRTKNLRALADEQARSGDLQSALLTLKRALTYDPNNLRTLYKKLEFEDTMGDESSVANTAQAIINVESTTYLSVRAIPELVQTEPFFARLKLVELATDPNRKIELLNQAIEGFKKYRNITVPKVMEFDKAGLDFGSEDMKTAREKMHAAINAAQELENLYRSSGNASAADGIRSVAIGFALD